MLCQGVLSPRRNRWPTPVGINRSTRALKDENPSPQSPRATTPVPRRLLSDKLKEPLQVVPRPPNRPRRDLGERGPNLEVSVAYRQTS